MINSFLILSRRKYRQIVDILVWMGPVLRFLKPFVIFSAITVATGVVLVVFSYFIILPSYTNSKARLFTSGLGYARILRSSGKPFPVTVGYVTKHRFGEPILGEGIMACQPVLVPVIPIERVTRIHVRSGDRVSAGQILMQLDRRRAELKIESAKLAISTMEAEASRVRIGSAYVLAQERPRKDEIVLEAAQKNAQRIKDEQSTYRQAYEKGLMTRVKFFELEKQLIEEQKQIDLAEFNLGMSARGVKESVKIAENAVIDAKRELEHRLVELEEYDVKSPCDGIVERVLLAEGEYNQDSGKPGVVLASGLWFECHLDQRVIDRIQPGLQAEIFLEAYPGLPLPAKLTRVVPIVSFNLGGPETNRPLRPRGSGGPEWPATFKVKIEFDQAVLDQNNVQLVPGLTGFGEIFCTRESDAVPLAAVSSLSAGVGYVNVLLDEGKWEARQVRTGAIDKGLIEIHGGLNGDETLLTHGFEILEEGDLVEVTAEYQEMQTE